MNCLKCQNQVTEADGYETESGEYIHHGCAMLVEGGMPRKKMAHSLKDLMAAKKKVDATNERIEARRKGN